MQNVYFQIAAGFAPVTLLVLLISLFSKTHKSRNIAFSVILISVIGVLVVPQSVSQARKHSAEEKFDCLNLVYAIADEGSFGIAQTLLQELRENYKPEYTIAAARFAALKGDYSTSKALYMKTASSYPETKEELTAVSALCDAEDSYYSISDRSDVPKVYALRAKMLSLAIQSISSAIEKSITETEDHLYGKLAKLIVYADSAHKAYLYDGGFVKSDAEKQLKKMNSLLEENPGFLEISQIRLARLKLQILCEDYKEIAENVNEHSDYNELLIVSELYLNNYVVQSNFRGNYSKENASKYQAVYDRLNDVYNNKYQDKPREDRNMAKAQLKALQTIIKNPALGKMEKSLSEYAASEYALDASKAYLQMAKIEHLLGNEQRSVEHIESSIDTVGDCEDRNYTAPMYELVSIISDKDNPERLKEAATYVEQILDNNMTVKLIDVEASGSVEGVEDALAGDFSAQMQTYVSQKRMSVKIVNVDTSNFDKDNTIKATMNISNNLFTSADELKAALSIKDCGVNIEKFNVEKVNYTSANILLCVDTSGSMQGYKIENLKNAIKLFAEDKAIIENIALITFNNDVSGDYPFGLSIGKLTAAADSIHASGGTAVYKSLIYSLSKFTKGPGVINSIILMTDGQDNNPASIDDIEEYIGKPAKINDIPIYTIGFGNDADSSYLNSIATVSGGAYLYASDPTASSEVNQLEEFFNGLRAQILNQYVITYEAVDTLSYSRDLKINVGDGLDGDRVTYYLGGGSDSITEPAFDENSPLFMQGKAVYGCEPRLLFKNGKTMKVVLKGEGFSADDHISVALKGNTSSVEWDMGTEFLDPYSISVTIPAGIGLDVYDAYVTINGKTAVLNRGLSIFKQGSEIVTDFGQYRFVSYTMQQKENAVLLSGYVTMNGWLNFNGDVTLTGNLGSSSISISELSGSYVSYEKLNSEGLATVLANIGLRVNVPAFGITTLYNDTEYEKQNFDAKVEAFPLSALDLGKYFLMNQTQVKLYPNRVEFDAESIIATLPFANKLLKNKADLFSFDYAFGGSLSSKNIGVKIDLEYSPGSTLKETFFPVNLGNAPIYISPKDTELHIDTLANDYEFKFMVKTAFIAGQTALGLSAKWDNPDSGDTLNNHSNGLIPTEFKLHADFDITTSIAGVPVTYSDFMLGIEEFDTSKNPIYWTLVGGCDVSAAKISAVPGMNGLKEWIGDVSVLKLDDAKLSLNLGECYIKAETSLKLFDELNCGNVLIEIGKFPYTCALLNMSNEPVAGLRFVGTLGPDWEFGESSLKLQITGEFDALSKFIGLQGKGAFDAEFKVWIVSIGASLNGDAAIGIRITSDGTAAFIVRTDPALPNGGLTWPKNVAGKS